MLVPVYIENFAEGDCKHVSIFMDKGTHLLSLLVCEVWKIGPLHCASCFHSRDRHNVPSSSDSRDPRNPGIPLASGQDIYLADEDKCLCRGRQVFWPARLADQQRVVASQVTQVGQPDKTSWPAREGPNVDQQWLFDPLHILCFNILVK